MFFHREFLKRGAPAGGIEQITDDDDQAGMREEIGEGVNADSAGRFSPLQDSCRES